MAHAVEATVTFLLGGVDTTFFTSANIQKAMAEADYMVDAFGSTASANTKIFCANQIATEIMLHGRANLETKGLISDAGHIGSSAKSTAGHDFHISPFIRGLLSNKPRPTFNTTTPSLNRDWS